jgi:Fatty-acid desaturase
MLLLTIAKVPAMLAASLMVPIKIGVCMSVCMHRYAAHAAFKCAWPTNLLLGVIGCLAFQGGPLWWASKHRAHHRFCDADKRDPHSPLLMGPTNAFIFFLTGDTPHDRWRMQAVDEDFAPPHCDSRGMRLVDSFSWLWPLLEWRAALWTFGMPGLWASFTSSWLAQAICLWFNVRNHIPHEHTPAKTRCTAVDTVVPGGGADCLYFAALGKFSALLAPIVGEASHKHHHDHPALARRPGGVDIPYAVCAALEAAGLVWSVKLSAAL